MRPQSAENGTVVHSAHSALDNALVGLLNAHMQECDCGRPLLTVAGIYYIRQRLLRIDKAKPLQDTIDPSEPAPESYPLPSWDPESRRLWLGERLLKQFRQPAPNQTRLLDVFEEQGWRKAHIDDPLSLYDGENGEDAKRRLHETLKNLNRHLPAGTIRFRGDGTGQGIAWEWQLSRS